jgi:glycosyltransferase involved in cell wall biosynthesis
MLKMMRILTCCYEFPPVGGGGGAVAAGLGHALSEAGHSVHLVTMGFRGLPSDETRGRLTMHRVPALRRRLHYCSTVEAATYLATAPMAIRRTLAARSYDLIHAHFLLPDGLLALRAARRAGIPYVVTAHGSDVPGYNPDRLRRTHHLLQPVWRRITRGAARIVCPSTRLRELALRADPGLGIETIPNGLDPAAFVASRPRRRRILVATRLLPRKGVQHLLTAIAGLPLDHEVHVAGDGPQMELLRAMAASVRVPVTFHGWLANDSPEYKDLLETSSIFVLPSEGENFPMVLLEAMAAGLAIVTTKGTGCDEVVGQEAVLVPPGDPAALRQALAALDSDPARCQSLGRGARLRLEGQFTWSAVAGRYEELFRNVLGESTARAGDA